MAISDMTIMWEGSFEGDFTAESGTVVDVARVTVANLSTTLSQLVAPAAHTVYSNMFCENVSTKKLGDVNESTGGPLQMELKITYKTPETGDGEAPPYIQNNLNDWTENWEAVGEAVTIGEGFHWVSDVALAKTPQTIKNADISAVKIFPQAAFSLTGRTDRFDSDAKDLVLSTQGHTNASAVTIKGYVYLTDHLLFESFGSTEGTDAFGNSSHTLVYNYSYRRDNTWNEFWFDGAVEFADGSGTFSVAPRFRGIVDEDGGTPYTSVPFSDIDPANW